MLLARKLRSTRRFANEDLRLSWSEAELPERERTKHVHRLHPYLGEFIPQLVERLLERYVRPGGHVLDPFAGSGTTLVQALESGFDAAGVDAAAFNALLMRVKTGRYDAFLLQKTPRHRYAARSRRRASERLRAQAWSAT
ncbi:MAG: site-specific DNA-methyltransferase [Actinobacteria bacterium]|nr:MAG: site-specific DNA-methyltransferase [Actinomycetota bacterium]